MEKICATCRAFEPQLGECRLHPPDVMSSDPFSTFPVVNNFWWCLDWQPKETPREAKPSTYQRAMQTITDPSEFDRFWAEYPRRIGKKAAQKAFQNARDRPRIDDLLESIRKAKASPQWAKDGGQYIPHPATWLNRGQWADVPTETKPTVFEEFLARGEQDDAHD